MDAGVRKGQGRSAAVVCRDRNGNFLGSSSLVIGGVDDPATLEAITCLEALALAEDLQLQHVIIASDVKQVVLDINSSSKGSYGAIISEIHLYSSLFQCKFTYESRKVNVEAHKLAKFSLSLGLGRHVWFDQSHDPTCIPQLVVFDE